MTANLWIANARAVLKSAPQVPNCVERLSAPPRGIRLEVPKSRRFCLILLSYSAPLKIRGAPGRFSEVCAPVAGAGAPCDRTRTHAASDSLLRALDGSFSAVSAPIFATKCSFFRVSRSTRCLHFCTARVSTV